MRQRRSNVPCPNNCGSRWWKRDSVWDDEKHDFVEVWKCINCSATQPYTTRKLKLVDTEWGRVTTAQARQLKWLHREVFRTDGPGSFKTIEKSADLFEYKKFEIYSSETSPFVPGKGFMLVTEVGRKGDEGTVGELYCRERRLISIEPSGGMKLLNPYDEKRTIRGKHVAWAMAKR